MSALKRLFIGLLVIGLIVLGLTQGLIMSAHRIDESDRSADYVIILGAQLDGDKPKLALEYRLETALDYLEKHPQTIAICSGGRGVDESISEAQAMGEWLEEKGIDKTRIVLEAASKNTFENFLYSAQLIRQAGDSRRVAIATSGYHLYRASLLAKRQGLEPILLAAKTPGVIVIKSYVRESLALIKSYFLDR